MLNTEQHSLKKQIKKPFLDSIAESAIKSQIRIFPVGDKKSPLIMGWQKPDARVLMIEIHC